MRILEVTFLSLVSISLSAANTSMFSKLSETMREKCSNSHQTAARYTCHLDSEGALIFMLREDPTSTDSSKYFTSKKVWLNKINEQLTHVEEYSENGELKLVVHFDDYQRVIQSKTLAEKRETIKNYKGSTSPDIKLSLSSQHTYENQNYLSGFVLDWATDEKTGQSFVKKWAQLGSDQKIISSFDSQHEIECNRSNLNNRVILMLAEGLNMDIHLPQFTNHLFYNNQERIDGIDNDNNGLIDDCVGFNTDENRSSHLSVINPILPEEGGQLQGINHGTMVADIATRGNSKVLLYPASGSIREPLYYV